jgi:perosamine synthetase
MQHAVPVFVDIDPRNLGMDPSAASARIGRRTAAILCTDHGGNPCDYAKLSALADRNGLPLIVDGAQSLGSMFAGRPTLSYGLVSTISFHAAKCMTTVEGGMVFTDDEALARRMRIIRSQGEDPHRKYHHIELGHNYRMTELQAAIGLAQLEKLDALLADRQSLAAEYQTLFARHGLTSPGGLPHASNSHFLYTLLVPQRDAVAARLKSRGIDTRVCYPMPLYRQPIFRHLRTPRCPITEETCATILNPPMFYGLTAAQQWRVANELAEAITTLCPRELRAAG